MSFLTKRVTRRFSVEPEIKPRLYSAEKQQVLINELDASQLVIEKLWRKSLSACALFLACVIFYMMFHQVRLYASDAAVLFLPGVADDSKGYLLAQYFLNEAC
jgi:hypothetical protein